MLGFLRHFATGLITIKKSTIFANSTLRILIQSVRFIPSMVAPQQSLSPFFLTCKYNKFIADTVYFTLPCQMGEQALLFIILIISNSNRLNTIVNITV